ncbi:MAG: MerR family transcriptional regulator, partial [Bacteroidota bacterium]
MPYKEKVIEKKYYAIGEVADMFKVATSLIRFWESEFDVIRPKKNRKGNR